MEKGLICGLVSIRGSSPRYGGEGVAVCAIWMGISNSRNLTSALRRLYRRENAIGAPASNPKLELTPNAKP